MRRKIIDKGIRPDGRGIFDVRPIWCDVHMFARPHGSAVFTRGQTQVITMTTLGPLNDAQELDGIDEAEQKRYMHHYNMPPYSTGEAKPMRSPGRREIGHGALAERALEPMIPARMNSPMLSVWCRRRFLQWLHLHGQRLRLHSVPYVCGSADKSAGCRCCNGTYQGYRKRQGGSAYRYSGA